MEEQNSGQLTSVTGGDMKQWGSHELDGSWWVALYFILCPLQGIIQI